MNAYLLLDIPASIVPDQEIITFKDVRLSYKQLTEDSAKLAKVLSNAGIGKGDRIGLITTNCPEMIKAFFAAFQLGAVIVPINYRSRFEELSYMIQDSSLSALLFEERYGNLIKPIIESNNIKLSICIEGDHPVGESYQKLTSEIKEPISGYVDVDENDLAILLYTSGTTSKPKGVMISYGQLTNYVMNHSEVADGTDRGSSLVCIPGYHIAGATSLCNSVYNGRRIVLMRQFNAKEWLETVEKESVNHAFLVPTMLKQALDHPNFTSTNLTSIENLSYGAAQMPLPVIKEAIKLFPATTDFANAFGMTETTSTVSVLGPEDHKLVGTDEEIEKKIQRLSSVGRPLPGVEIMIVDDNNKEIKEPNVVGHIYVRTSRSMKGYWNRPEASKETLVDGWVNTEDMGWLDEDGYLFLGGRNSDMIIRGGENIAPAEIEDVLLEHPTVADVAVIGIPSLEWGEEIIAIIVVEEDEITPTPEELKTFCRSKLASFKCPLDFNFVSELPRTSTGKILKRTLRDKFISKYLPAT